MTTELANTLNKSLSIGNRSIAKRLVLAPMAFVGNIAFRELVEKFGGYGLLFTEMCSAKRIPNENRYTSSYFRWRDSELSYLVCQIFGADPALMAAAAQRIETEGFFGIDINFGCSDVSICRQNCGAAILNAPDLAAKIVAAVRIGISYRDVCDFPPYSPSSTGLNFTPTRVAKSTRAVEMIIIMMPSADSWPHKPSSAKRKI